MANVEISEDYKKNNIILYNNIKRSGYLCILYGCIDFASKTFRTTLCNVSYPALRMKHVTFRFDFIDNFTLQTKKDVNDSLLSLYR